MYPIVSPRRLESGLNHPVTTGPTAYPGSPNILGFLCGNMAFKYILLIYLYIQARSTRWTLASLLLFTGFSFSYLWPYFYIRPSFRTVASTKFYQPFGNIACGFFLFIVDTFLLLVLLFLVIVYGTDIFFKVPEGEKVTIFAVIPVIGLLVANGIGFAMIQYVDVREYSPMSHSNRYQLVARTEKSNRNKVFSIKESNSFRIEIQNCSDQPWSEPLVIQREIRWMKNRTKRRPEEAAEMVKFYFFPKEPLETGETWTFIPETHREERSYRIGGFRSFGRDRGEKVSTVVMKYTHWVELERLDEHYAYTGVVSTDFTMRYGRYGS